MTFDLAIRVISDNNTKVIAASFDETMSYVRFLDNLYLKEGVSLDRAMLLSSELTVKVPVTYSIEDLKKLATIVSSFYFDVTSIATVKIPENGLNNLVKVGVVNGVVKLIPPSEEEVIDYLFRLI
jgi:hypothetical protein